ncbi:hypothetical protein ABFS83_08G114500 [Erythranthe nasuta]
MENPPSEAIIDGHHPQITLINTFCEITACASQSEALFFLESHNFDLDAAVSTFLDDANPVDSAAAAVNPTSPAFNSPIEMSPSPSPSRSRSRSPSPPPASRSYSLRSSSKPSTAAPRRGIRTFSDLNRNPKDDDEDSDSDPDFNPQDYYTGGEKSGMVVRDPSRANNVDAIFNQARRAGAVEASADHQLPSSSSSRGFTGTPRLLSGDDVPSTTTTTPPHPPQNINHIITFWRNGFTVNDGPFRRLDDPLNAPFLESIKKSECPTELVPADKNNQVRVSLVRKDDDYKEPKKRDVPFRGVGRTLGSSSDDVTITTTLVEPETVLMTSAPAPSMGMVVDETQSTTSIQLRLADGTRMVSRFNNNHTIRDVRAFIDASRPQRTSYQLQSMGFPPKKLDDLDQTIDQAGIANSVVIQRL